MTGKWPRELTLDDLRRLAELLEVVADSAARLTAPDELPSFSWHAPSGDGNPPGLPLAEPRRLTEAEVEAARTSRDQWRHNVLMAAHDAAKTFLENTDGASTNLLGTSLSVTDAIVQGREVLLALWEDRGLKNAGKHPVLPLVDIDSELRGGTRGRLWDASDKIRTGVTEALVVLCRPIRQGKWTLHLAEYARLLDRNADLEQLSYEVRASMINQALPDDPITGEALKSALRNARKSQGRRLSGR